MKTQEEIEQLAKEQKGCSKEYCDSIDDQVVATVMGELDGIMSELKTILQDKLNNLEEE
jgi:hypothetical protein